MSDDGRTPADTSLEHSKQLNTLARKLSAALGDIGEGKVNPEIQPCASPRTLR